METKPENRQEGSSAQQEPNGPELDSGKMAHGIPSNAGRIWIYKKCQLSAEIRISMYHRRRSVDLDLRPEIS